MDLDVFGFCAFATFSLLLILIGQVAIKQEARSRVIAWDTCRGQKVPAELRNLLDVQQVPGVVKLLEFYERDDSFIYVMERFKNYMDLYDFINREKQLSEAMALDFFCQVSLLFSSFREIFK